MKHFKIYLLSLVAAVLVSCGGTTKTVPITGRQQSLMVSDGDILSLSTQQYSEFMKSAKLSTNAENTAMVKRVGQNLATAVTAYLKAAGMQSDLQYYKWQFNLVQSNEVNAWCMPGGLICVYEGILPVTKDEASLAIVLGHEIAHAVARHSAEQMSTQMKQQYGVQTLGSLASILGIGSSAVSIGQAIAAQGLNFANLKYSRNHETHLRRYGRLRSSGSRQLLAAHVAALGQQALRVPKRSPLRRHPYPSDPRMDARGPEVLQACQDRHDDHDGQDA